MFQIIEIHPGEQAQILHYDDSFYPLARPRPPISVASILAVDEFTSENGGTVIVVGSHKWPDGRRPTADDPRVSLEMKAGSAVIFAGTLWHGAGPIVTANLAWLSLVSTASHGLELRRTCHWRCPSRWFADSLAVFSGCLATVCTDPLWATSTE